uniref:Uncharacterized protein n=1 Tax=Candidatus Kentrum sp. LPFa TaxID=2126335 RepID=A0A450WSX9_9GAMM|nr:MAG: hypothetical protein BECKLPF1236B_GA0070989_11987 [Candidatus Kentron sp. LPFa]
MRHGLSARIPGISRIFQGRLPVIHGRFSLFHRRLSLCHAAPASNNRRAPYPPIRPRPPFPVHHRAARAAIESGCHPWRSDLANSTGGITGEVVSGDLVAIYYSRHPGRECRAPVAREGRKLICFDLSRFLIIAWVNLRPICIYPVDIDSHASTLVQGRPSRLHGSY